MLIKKFKLTSFNEFNEFLNKIGYKKNIKTISKFELSMRNRNKERTERDRDLEKDRETAN